MCRPLRIQGAGLIYHVMARGNNKMAIFLDDLDYAQCLDMFAEVVETFEIDAWVTCAMPNHYHLVLRTRRPNLSRAIGHLNGRYAQWWNKRHAHIGHVFQGRFKAQVVEASVYLLRLCRYVLLNPVRAGLCSHPRQWRWNSYGALAGTTESTCVDIDSLLRCVDGTDVDTIRARLLAFVSPDADPDMIAFIRNDERVIGTPAFAEQFQPRARAASREVPVRERRIGTPALVDILSNAVLGGVGLADGVQRARESAGYSIAEIARCAGLSEKTVARMARGVVAPGPRAGTSDGRIVDLTPKTGGS